MTGADGNLRRNLDRFRPGLLNSSPFWTDISFQKAAQHYHQLKEVFSYLPSDLSTEIFQGQAEIEKLLSSYNNHGYGYLFYALTRVLKPEVCVEIGVLQGFSLLHIASALRDNGNGTIHGFDLFEDYPYRHDDYAIVSERIGSCGLSDWASVNRADGFQVHEKFKMVDFLHVDISNNGDTFRQMFAQWATQVRQVILLEGGSAVRDQVQWMIEYEKPPISLALEEIRVQYPKWHLVVLEPFPPSLTIALPAN